MNKFFSKLLVVMLVAHSAAHATSAVHPDQLVQAAPAPSLAIAGKIAAKAVQNWVLAGYGPLQLTSGLALTAAGMYGYLVGTSLLYWHRGWPEKTKDRIELGSIAAASLAAAVAGGALIYKGLTS